MDQPSPAPPKCCCSISVDSATPVISPGRKTVRSVPSIILSVLIAFFPKCPMCWAAYMSMFGCIGMAQVPYMRWLLPVLVVFLGLHLLLLYNKVRKNGYGAFLLSLAGACFMLLGRTVFPAEKWMIISAMSVIISGSLFNSFSHSLSVPFKHKIKIT